MLEKIGDWVIWFVFNVFRGWLDLFPEREKKENKEE
jgi:hypothetical protein